MLDVNNFINYRKGHLLLFPNITYSDWSKANRVLAYTRKIITIYIFLLTKMPHMVIISRKLQMESGEFSKYFILFKL